MKNKFCIRSQEDALEALEYFNYFHDGFLTSFALEIEPESDMGFGFALPVIYNATLRFSHSNYPSSDGMDNGIEIVLGDLKSVGMKNIVPVDNMIQECLISVSGGENPSIKFCLDGMVNLTSTTMLIVEENEAKK